VPAAAAAVPAVDAVAVLCIQPVTHSSCVHGGSLSVLIMLMA
jgi:hypothetical protein